jgi:hypothetical protein
MPIASAQAQQQLVHEELRIVKAIYNRTNIVEEIRTILQHILMNSKNFLKSNGYKLSLCFFSNNKSEQGQIGIPSEEDAESLIDLVMIEGNVRELMTMCMNVYKDPNRVGICKSLFRLMLDVKLDPTKNTSYTNRTHVLSRIDDVERILGFDITEAGISYDDTSSFPSLCTLWNPIVFIHGSHVLTNPHVSWTGNLTNMVKPKTLRSEPVAGCKVDEIIPVISSRESAFLGERDPYEWWKPGKCWFDDNPDSLAAKVRQRNGKLSVANTSGHTMLHIEFANMFYTGQPENWNNFNRMMIIACIMWMVPYDHAIHEIMTAAKIMHVCPEYDYKLPTSECVRSLQDSVVWRNAGGGGSNRKVAARKTHPAKSGAWISTGRKATLKDGSKRTLYKNEAKPSELRIKKIVERKGARVASYVRI